MSRRAQSSLLLAVVVAHNKAAVLFLGRPGRREATDGHSISRFFRRLAPFPFAGLPVVASNAALDHFVPPAVACDDEGGQVATAEAKRAKARYDDELQRLTHCSSSGSLTILAAIRRALSRASAASTRCPPGSPLD